MKKIHNEDADASKKATSSLNFAKMAGKNRFGKNAKKDGADLSRTGGFNLQTE